MPAVIRLACDDDAEQIVEIYAPFVRHTPISFELEPPTSEQMRHRIYEVMERLPWLICANEGQVMGYVYASPHRSRAAYQWSVDVAVYIHAACHRQGVGRGLYTSLLALLRLQGYYNAYAGITLPNAASVGMHEALGFEPVGIYRSVGYKLGAWHDVGWWELPLLPRTDPEGEPKPFKAISNTQAAQAAMTVGLPFVRTPVPSTTYASS